MEGEGVAVVTLNNIHMVDGTVHILKNSGPLPRVSSSFDFMKSKNVLSCSMVFEGILEGFLMQATRHYLHLSIFYHRIL